MLSFSSTAGARGVPMASEHTCYVGGLAWATDYRSLRNAFASFGDVLYSKVIIDRATGRSRGFGFVTFASETSMRSAISGMNAQTLDGRRITVSEARPRQGGGRGRPPQAARDNISDNGKQICPIIARLGTGTGDDSDDDCVALEGDPHGKMVMTTKDDIGKDCGFEDLLIVGEKGELACRDFPHPRHACASFPFTSVPHYKYCSKCHCYVCDSPAPCKYWHIGRSSTDHCHATDKEAKWKTLRDFFKQSGVTYRNSVISPVIESQRESITPPSTSNTSRNSVPRCISNSPSIQRDNLQQFRNPIRHSCILHTPRLSSATVSSTPALINQRGHVAARSVTSQLSSITLRPTVSRTNQGGSLEPPVIPTLPSSSRTHQSSSVSVVIRPAITSERVDSQPASIQTALPRSNADHISAINIRAEAATSRRRDQIVPSLHGERQGGFLSIMAKLFSWF